MGEERKEELYQLGPIAFMVVSGFDHNVRVWAKREDRTLWEGGDRVLDRVS